MLVLIRRSFVVNVWRALRLVIVSNASSRSIFGELECRQNLSCRLAEPAYTYSVTLPKLKDDHYWIKVLNDRITVGLINFIGYHYITLLVSCSCQSFLFSNSYYRFNVLCCYYVLCFKFKIYSTNVTVSNEMFEVNDSTSRHKFGAFFPTLGWCYFVYYLVNV